MRQAVVFCGCQQSIFSEADSPKQQLQPLTELRVITDPAYKNIYRSISADRWCYCANYDQAHYMWSTFTRLLPHEELPEVCCCHKENNNMFIFPALPRVLILMFFRELCKQTHKIYWEDVSERRQPKRNNRRASKVSESDWRSVGWFPFVREPPVKLEAMAKSKRFQDGGPERGRACGWPEHTAHVTLRLVVMMKDFLQETTWRACY